MARTVLSHTNAAAASSVSAFEKPASANAEGNQPAVKLSQRDQQLEERWQQQKRPPQHVKAASLADLFGFMPKKGEGSAVPFPTTHEDIALTAEEIDHYLEYSPEEAAALRGRERKEFEAALFQKPAIALKSWQREERERIDRENHGKVRDQVMRDTAAGSSRFGDVLGGAYATA